MNTTFAAAMRRASEETRAQNLSEATRLIQAALSGRPETASAIDAATRPAALSSVTAAAVDPTDAGPSGPKVQPLGEAFHRFRANRTPPAALAGFRGMTPASAQMRTEPSVPAGARFDARVFSCAEGSRSYKLYVPSSEPARPRGLVVMLHGCTQNPDDFARGTGMNEVAERNGFAVAYPGQTRSDNANGCWNWFEPKHQRRGAGEPAILAGLTEAIVSEFGIDPARVFIAGLSAGGAMAMVMAEMYPELFAAVGVHSGLPTNAAKDVASAFAAMRGNGKAQGSSRHARYPGRTIVFQGSADTTVHPSNASRIIDAATPETASISSHRTEAGKSRRAATVTVVADQAGYTVAELWLVDSAGHAWSGGQPGGSFVDPAGPDASLQMMRFFSSETAAR